jgi:hypothetical protein
MSSGFTNMHAMPVEASSCYRKPEVPWRGRTESLRQQLPASGGSMNTKNPTNLWTTPGRILFDLSQTSNL